MDGIAMTQHNSQPQPSRQYLIGDIQISGNNNESNFVQGDNNHFFKYEITPQGGVVNILPPEQAPRITARPAPIRLRPRAFSKLLGREKEIAQGVTAFKASQTIELYGSVGIGKSVLLRQLAHHGTAESLQHFPDGVIYFHLLREEPVEDLQQKLFEAFYDSDRPFKPSAVRVRHDLQNKRALILLDNAKLSRKDIEKLGETAPNCVFAFTSLERSLWGEEQPIQVSGLSSNAALDLIGQELKRSQSFTDQEQAAVTAICSSLNGHPLEILQQIVGVRESKESLADVARRVQRNPSQKARIEHLLKPLDQQKRSILAALAALGGIAISAKQALAIADEGTASDLGDLEKMHLVQQEDSHYSLSTNLLSSIEQIENLTPYIERAVFFVTKWAQNTTPEKLQQESEAISYLLQWLIKQGRWSDVLLLGKPFESALALSGQWELQAQVLQRYAQAAENLGDNSAVAWALHQLGVRSLGLGKTSRAQNLLNKAFKLRQELGDLRGAELTQRCLNFKFPTVPPITDFLVPIPPQPSPSTDLLSKALVPALVGVTVLSLLSYELFKSHQETANLQRENQELREETVPLKEKASTSSSHESELMLTIEKITKERGSLQKERDDASKRAAESDKRAKNAEQNMEALKKRPDPSVHNEEPKQSNIGINNQLFTKYMNVNSCLSRANQAVMQVATRDIRSDNSSFSGTVDSSKSILVNIRCLSVMDHSAAVISVVFSEGDESTADSIASKVYQYFQE
ncbi:hypothetical protein H6F76_28015 [Leptolyngbya sp. FACHB-321]|uniref:NB-ARC domain-containing protein n=1 Tax=Leptolyngbya sp. FACHB-321 TaxID=2692807 RepID=UPI001688785D|nr:NB-ARC domain-containing protein [Leptolyngbya sp. FACHB-321]MBD2038802.1 hypothetical protein [Leptolyngbya sp. FACHB-321]